MQRNHFHRNHGSSIVPSSSRRFSEKVKNILILLLVAALAVSLILGVPAMQSIQKYQHDVISRMAADCGDAQFIVTHLSNTGSSSTYAQLARIRSAVYAIDVLNQSYTTLPGAKDIVSKQLLSDVYTQIDNYYTALISSSTNTSILLNDLTTALQNLQEALKNPQ